MPETWKRAALSRVWASDPAISQFVGLADYAWDWNAPDGVPGFGPLRPTDNVAELLSQAIGQITAAERKEVVSDVTTIASEGDADPGITDEELSDLPKDASESDTESERPPATEPACDPAMQVGHGDPAIPVRQRRGGGALPI